jgi:hypothetical protein
MAAALGAVYRHAGYRIVGVVPTGRAARGLAERGIESWTAHRLADDLDYAGGFSGEPTVLFYDEAGWLRRGRALRSSPRPSTPGSRWWRSATPGS